MQPNDCSTTTADLHRIAFISEHDDPLAASGGVGKGGQNVYVREVAQRLADYGWQVDVFTRRDAPDTPAIEPFGAAARVIRINAGPARSIPKEALAQYLPVFTEQIMSIAQQTQPTYQLVHGHYYLSGVLACALQQQYGLPFVQTFHSLGAIKRQVLGARDGSPADRIATERSVAAVADRIVATSPQERDDLIALYDVPTEKIHIIPCGVDSEQFQPGAPAVARHTWGLAPDRFLIAFVGRIEPQKGIEVLLHAIAQLRAQRPQLALQAVIVGGSARERSSNGWSATTDAYTLTLEALAASLGISDALVWTGALPHSALPDIYSAADVFVIPSRYESFGMTALEALACGACVVAARTGGLQTTLDHGRAGLLFTPNSAEDLAATLALLASQPATRAEFQRKARPYVLDIYTWERIASQLSALYVEMTARRW